MSQRRDPARTGLRSVDVYTPPGRSQRWGSHWMLMSANWPWIAQLPRARRAAPAQPTDAGRLWTDDHTVLFRVLRR
jgi:hypothetical protein